MDMSTIMYIIIHFIIVFLCSTCTYMYMHYTCFMYIMYMYINDLQFPLQLCFGVPQYSLMDSSASL